MNISLLRTPYYYVHAAVQLYLYRYTTTTFGNNSDNLVCLTIVKNAYQKRETTKTLHFDTDLLRQARLGRSRCRVCGRQRCSGRCAADGLVAATWRRSLLLS